MRDSLTDLADFVHKRGTPRLTHVRKLNRRGAYHPDSWKPLRDEIVRFHARSDRKTDHLESVLAKVSASKQGRYSECISGYKPLQALGPASSAAAAHVVVKLVRSGDHQRQSLLCSAANETVRFTPALKVAGGWDR